VDKDAITSSGRAGGEMAAQAQAVSLSISYQEGVLLRIMQRRLNQTDHHGEDRLGRVGLDYL